MSDQRTGTCGVCGRRDVPVLMIPGNDKPVCVDEVACYVEFRRRAGWDAIARLVDPSPETAAFRPRSLG